MTLTKSSKKNLYICLPVLLEVVTNYDIEIPQLSEEETIHNLRAVQLQENVNYVYQKLLKAWFK